MHSAWVIIATAFAFSTIAIAAQPGNFTTVAVGKDGKLAFEPPFLSGFAGSTVDPLTNVSSGGVVFHFYKADPPHNISQSTFEQPCVHKPGTLWLSGVPESRDFAELWLHTGNETLWFYDSTGSRCASGMVFAINPTLAQTYEVFRATAMGRNASTVFEPSPYVPNSSVKRASTSIQKIATAALAGVIQLFIIMI